MDWLTTEPAKGRDLPISDSRGQSVAVSVSACAAPVGRGYTALIDSWAEAGNVEKAEAALAVTWQFWRFWSNVIPHGIEYDRMAKSMKNMLAC